MAVSEVETTIIVEIYEKAVSSSEIYHVVIDKLIYTGKVTRRILDFLKKLTSRTSVP